MTPLSTIKSERHVFDTFWFKENQRVLLWLLNAPVIKYWFRWIMNIPAGDCPVKDNIFEIQPNNYKVYLGLFLTKDGLRHKIKVDFKTKNRYANRLYCALYPLWVALHIWDLFADKAFPKLSFGFSTLTQYPGSIGSRNPVDEFVARIGVDETFSTIRAGAGTDVNPDSDSTRFAQISANATSNHYDRIDRYIFCFDTSSLTSGAIISAATLSIYGTDKESGLSGTAINIYSSNPAATNNYSAADFNTLGSTAFATAISNASYSTSGYNAFTLNASGIAGISLAGITKMGTREASFDATGTGPTWVSNARSLFNARGEHFDGNTSGPKLVITYTTPTAYTKTLTETLYDTSMLSKQISKSFIEAMANILTFSTQSVLYRTLDESIADHDALNKKTSKILSDTNYFTDALVREMTKVLSEAINYAATFYKQSLKSLTEIVANLDAMLLMPIKVLTESISYTSSLAKTVVKAFSESVINIANLNILSNFYRTMAETLANIDFAAFQKTMFKALTESLHPIDAMTKLAKKVFAEVIHGIDALQKQTLIALLEAVNYIASLTRHEMKALKETIYSIDSLIKSTALVLKDTAHHADVIVKKTLKNFTETMHGTASLSRRGLKVIEEIVHFSDIIMAKIFFKILAETLHMADSISKKLSRNLKETLSIADSMVGRMLESLKKTTLKLATKLNNILKLKI